MRTAEAAATPPAMSAGDRAPNFVLPGTDGKLVMLYERVKGNPFVLFFFGDATAAQGRAELAGFARRQAQFAATGADILAVGHAPVEAAASLCRELGIGFPVLADVKGAISAGYLVAAGLPADRPACFLLDANQRVLALRGDEPGQAEWALAALASRPPAPAPLSLGSVAPVLIVPDVLPRPLCRDLIARWHADHAEGTVSSMSEGVEYDRVYHAMKKRRDHLVRDPALERLLADLVSRRLLPELSKAFDYRQTVRFDRFTVTCYDAKRGDYFRRHRDNLSPGTANRRFALTLNLNTDEHEGGQLLFPEYGPHLYAPPAGGAIVFSCSLLHEALPVTRGRRFTLLSFIRDTRKEVQPRIG